ncbi:MAG: hypothetical protein QXD04_06245 [Candidatus Bathyarchaeia archaeon]|nr:hypothetical protein [Candidatus Bathyarchaeota archaeon]
MEEKYAFKEALRRNRQAFLVVLLLPVFGMTLSIPLIIVRSPRNLAVSLSLISILLVQYLVLFLYIKRRIDSFLSS